MHSRMARKPRIGADGTSAQIARWANEPSRTDSLTKKAAEIAEAVEQTKRARIEAARKKKAKDEEEKVRAKVKRAKIDTN